MTALQLPFDFRFVWEGAKLTFPFVRRGIVPEGAVVSTLISCTNVETFFIKLLQLIFFLVS